MRASDDDLQAAVDAFRRFGSKAEAARQLGLPATTLSDRLALAEEHLGLKTQGLVIAQGKIDRRPQVKLPLPKAGEVARYILTSAQNNTFVHEGVWQNLLALADHYDARLMVGTFSYNKASYGDKSVKRGAAPTADDRDECWYDPQVIEHLVDHQVALAPGLVWCGEINTIPTAPRPLSGFESYTGRSSAIFPHAKFAMASVAAGKYEPTKFNFTSGTVTRMNYIQKRAGIKAETLHGYGGLLAEVLPDGSWFVRQLEAGPNADIQDLTVRAAGGVVTTGHRVSAIGWGDTHLRAMDPQTEEICWGEGGMLDELRPENQFIHDVLDFWARGHHEIKNPHRMFERFVKAYESVEREVADVADYLNRIKRDWCETLVVDANHDRAMTRWLETTTHHEDPVNALFYLEASLEVYRAIARKDRWFHLLEWAARRAGVSEKIRFLREDESFIIEHAHDGGIECGMHGHHGINGRRGSPEQFSRMGRRANTGHTHSAGIVDGVFTGGVMGSLDMGYNKGPSSWSHSNVVTYPGGMRTIVTLWKGRWKA